MDRPSFPNSEAQVAKLIAAKEAERGVGEKAEDINKPLGRCDALGTKYDTVIWTIEGEPVNSEGQPFAVTSVNEKSAWALWAAAFLAYLEITPGKIYWRMKPRIRVHEPDGKFYVYARLCAGIPEG